MSEKESSWESLDLELDDEWDSWLVEDEPTNPYLYTDLELTLSRIAEG